MKRSVKAGFSFVEVIVSLAVMSAISLAVVSAFSIGKRVWKSAELAPETELLAAEVGMLKKTLSSRVFRATNSDYGEIRGNNTSLEFLGFSSTEGFNNLVRYEIKNSGTRTVVIAKSVRKDEIREVALKRVRLHGFEYYKSIYRGGEGVWKKVWQSGEGAYPDLIKIKLEILKENRPMEVILLFN